MNLLDVCISRGGAVEGCEGGLTGSPSSQGHSRKDMAGTQKRDTRPTQMTRQLNHAHIYTQDHTHTTHTYMAQQLKHICSPCLPCLHC